ncbi:MAG: DcaP family trimeric outer membrane transporter [Pseudomonadota bacterium]
MHRTSRLKPLAAALALSLAPPLHAADDSARLEARIAELERQIAVLLAERAPPKPAAPAAPGAPPPPPPIQATSILPNAAPGTRFSLTGFLRTDALATRTDSGEIPDGSVGRDLYVPGQIPVGGLDEGTDLDALVKWTRFNLGIDHATDAGDVVGGRLEFDLFGGALGNEQSTNTYGLTVRHAWFSWNRWLVGQTWTNAAEIGALVDGVDIVGATDAQVFVRQAQVRYTNGPWSFSLENPETTIAPAAGGARIASDDNSLPDLTARYTHRAPWGFLSGALLLRQLAYETTGTNAGDDNSVAMAGNLSGKLQLGATDDLRFSLTGGEAIGRYIGLGVASDAELDRDGTLEAVSGVAGFVGWRHVFSPQWRANLSAAASRYDPDPAVVGGAVTESVRSVSANVFWTPLPKLDLGAELRFARRKLESGADGDLRRLHLVARYSF